MLIPPGDHEWTHGTAGEQEIGFYSNIEEFVTYTSRESPQMDLEIKLKNSKSRRYR